MLLTDFLCGDGIQLKEIRCLKPWNSSPALEEICNKVDIKPVLLAPVTGEPMSSMLIGYGAESMNHAGKGMDEMGMSEEYQAMVRKGAALGELYRAWMSIPA